MTTRAQSRRGPRVTIQWQAVTSLRRLRSHHVAHHAAIDGEDRVGRGTADGVPFWIYHDPYGHHRTVDGLRAHPQRDRAEAAVARAIRTASPTAHRDWTAFGVEGGLLRRDLRLWLEAADADDRDLVVPPEDLTGRSLAKVHGARWMDGLRSVWWIRGAAWRDAGAALVPYAAPAQPTPVERVYRRWAGYLIDAIRQQTGWVPTGLRCEGAAPAAVADALTRWLTAWAVGGSLPAWPRLDDPSTAAPLSDHLTTALMFLNEEAPSLGFAPLAISP